MFKDIFTNFTKGDKTKKKSLLIGLAGIFSALYLANLTFGFDFLPDALPLIGNIDEATASLVLLASLKYFGIDLIEILTGSLGMKNNKDDIGKETQNGDGPRYEPPKG
jgi:hypothetical protein